MGQLFPVLNLLIFHLLHRSTGDDQSVEVFVFYIEVFVFYIVEGLIKLV